MRVGIGVDIERVERFRGSKASRALSAKLFSESEMAYCNGKAEPAVHAAGIFAAKEAALKAVRGHVSSRASIADFEVWHDDVGAPHIRYVGKDEGVRALDIGVSISHTKENAVAVAAILA